MVVGAAKLVELEREILRLAKSPESIAEINRRIGELAWERGLVRPSYARVRQLVNDERDRFPEPSWGELIGDVAFKLRPATVLADKGNLPVDEDAGIRHAARRRR